MTATETPDTIDAYIARFPPQVRERLEAVRGAVRILAPDAVETISYQIPTFRLAGTYLLYFAGWKQYVSVYPVPSGPADYEAAIAPYRKAKGTLQFRHAEPLPLDVVAMVTRARLRELRIRPAAPE
jgi:uncharacterized protein YdhG (YjbR/CyaY superfamily)